MALNPLKLRIAQVLENTGLSAGLLAAQARLFRQRLRAVNYHDVPPSQADAFADQLRFFRDRFAAVGFEELEHLREGRWPHDRPGLLISFDDGLRSHADIVAPLLSEH